ncbi:MAG: hypothetical protein NDJ89_14185 [Oligoflexia bacterium]|nr:hypothetical protein [Oligoflexia bacterium]
MRNRTGLLLLPAFLLSALPASADQYHYRNQLIGERASGMGGTYLGVSDDPTGIFYNPAGLVYGFENYISASANTYTTTETRYKDILPGHDYSQNSRALLPSFFGFTQSLGRDKIGFAVIVPESDLLNQDDELPNYSAVAGDPNTLKRRLYIQDTTYYFGPGYAKALGDHASIGVSLLGIVRLYTALDNQTIQYNPVPTGKFYFQNTHQSMDIYGLQPKLGFQYMPAKNLSLALVASKALTLSGTGKRRILATKLGPDNRPVVPSDNYSADFTLEERNLKPKLLGPVTVGAGAAYFPSKALLFTGDFTYYSADSEFTEFTVKSTFNASAGTEWYATESLALRFGLYTNNSNVANAAQVPQVNQYGATAAISLLKPGSSFTLGTAYAYGQGKGQAVANNQLQDVRQTSLSFYIAGGYQL